MKKPEKTKVAPAAPSDVDILADIWHPDDLRWLDAETPPGPSPGPPVAAAAAAPTKDDVFSFIFARWGRGAFRGFMKHVIPGEYEEWLAQLDKRLADCKDILPE